MTDAFDKVMGVAKKLRRIAKKVDSEVADLIVDLNLHLVDLKLQVAEDRETHRELARQLDHADQHAGDHGHHAAKHAPDQGGDDQEVQPWPCGEQLSSVVDTTGTNAPGR